MNPQILDRAKGCMLGLAIGDALGTTIEFSPRDTYPRVKDIVGGGPFDLKAGEWTDDTSMALCLADSLLLRGKFEPTDIMNRFINWMEHGYNSVTGECFDIGNATRAALQNYQSTGRINASANPNSAGNGSIMRLAPAILFSLEDRIQAIQLAADQSGLTHAAPEAVESCMLMGAIIHDLISGGAGPMPTLNESKIRAIAGGAYHSKKRDDIRSSGYVVDTLEAALWAVARTDNFKDAVLLAANLGDDADTVGAVTGQIAGAKWGYSAIPQEWLQKLVWREKIEKIAVSLAQSWPAPKIAATSGLTGPSGMA